MTLFLKKQISQAEDFNRKHEIKYSPNLFDWNSRTRKHYFQGLALGPYAMTNLECH